MSVLIFLIPIALIFGLIGVMAFLWSLKSKQYEDLEGAASRILFDDDDDWDEGSCKKSSEKEKNDG